IDGPPSMRQSGHRGALRLVNGDSMEPTLSNGDRVVCDACGYDSGEGLYAIRMNGCGYVKRIQAATGKFIIKSDNPKYDTLTEPMENEDIQVIGRVHYVLKHVS
ncbi:MAG: helix-turn-helix transcriptional regulator, partial [Treponemataceae bacterium]|nr:helix-turn-helix transcriptional regulator [Treponemataceae bacterium]